MIAITEGIVVDKDSKQNENDYPSQCFMIQDLLVSEINLCI